MRARLITIAYSHFCEKARWALDRGGYAYVEEPHAPGVHRFFAKRAGAPGSVPVLVTAAGELAADSNAIVALVADAARLFPADAAARAEVDALVARFDAELGPDARRVAYHDILGRPTDAVRVLRKGAPPWEGAVIAAAFPLLRAVMNKTMRISADGAARSATRVEAVFADVGARLASGRRFLVGDAFTAADLAFASLAAPIIMPPPYAARFPPGEAGSPALVALCEGLRRSPAGRFASRLYAEERDVVIEPRTTT